MTEEEIKHVAKLANLDISDKEIEKFKKQLEETIEYINHLSEVKTLGVTPTSQVTGLENIFREDNIKPSLSQEEALKNSQKTYKGYFVVKKIWD